MSESEFLRGRITAKHLAGAAPTDIHAASKKNSGPCNTFQTGDGCPTKPSPKKSPAKRPTPSKKK